MVAEPIRAERDIARISDEHRIPANDTGMKKPREPDGWRGFADGGRSHLPRIANDPIT